MKFFTVEGKKYLLKKVKHTKNGDTELRLIPYDSDKYKKLLKDIISKINRVIDSEALLEEVLSRIEIDELEKIHNSLKKGTKPKARRGCYEINIGKNKIGLVD